MSRQMSTQFSKRELISKSALSAGMGVGALALLTQTQRASADTPFTSFPFTATGAVTVRTMPDRLTEIRNVKDFGAKGDGVTDDTRSIQTAINAASSTGLNAYGVTGGAMVFFPSGVYRTTAPLTFGTGSSSIRLWGSGRHSCAIFGNFPGYVIDKPDNRLQNLEVIQGLFVKNDRAASDAGAIRFCAVEKGIIDDCYVQGFTGIDASANTYCTRLTNVEITNSSPAGTAGTVGIYTAQVGLYQCRIQGYDVGIQACNAGLVVSGCAIETTNTAIVLGKDRNGSLSQVSGFNVVGCQTERCNTALYLASCAGGLVAGNVFTGTVGVDGTAPTVYGIYIMGAQAVHFTGNVISSQATSGGVYLADPNLSGGNVTFDSCISTSWVMPTTNLAMVSFRNCNNPSAALRFRDLPGQPGYGAPPNSIEGMEFDITDGSTATWGATVSGGGSNHVKVRYNGSAWTVIGR
jgi:Pectate lyase superfamily protein